MLDWSLKWLLRLVALFFVVSIFIGLGVGILVAFLATPERTHLFRLLLSVWKLSLASLSQTSLSFVAYSLLAPLAAFFITLGLYRHYRPEGIQTEQLRDSSIVAVAGLAVPMIIITLVFGWTLVERTYNDHETTVTRIIDLRARIGNLVDPTSRDAQINELTKKLEESQRKIPGSAPRQGSPPATASSSPETIHDVLVELRTTCTLKNSSKMPDDLVEMTSQEPSYFQSAGGKSFVESRAANFRRTEEEGKVVTITNFKPVSNSDLVGQPISALSNYSLVHLADTASGSGGFQECNFIEVAVRVNGREVIREGQPGRIDPDDKGFNFNFRLNWAKLSQ